MDARLIQSLVLRGGVFENLGSLRISCQGRRQKAVARYRSHGVGEGSGPKSIENLSEQPVARGPCLRHLLRAKHAYI